MRENPRFQAWMAGGVLLLGLLGMRSPSFADVPLEVPAGFKGQSVLVPSAATGTPRRWLRVSNSTIAIYFYDLDQWANHAPRLDDQYEETLSKYPARIVQFSKVVTRFNAWLLQHGILDLDHALKQSPIQVFIDPMNGREVTNAGFRTRKGQSSKEFNWFIEVDLEPEEDLDFQFGDDALMIHEVSHFLFYRNLYELTTGVADPFTLGSMDEGFADFVSYVFTRNPVVGKRYDYDQGRVLEFRRALSSSAAARSAVRNGTWSSKRAGMDPHNAGEPFRDVMIEVAEDYGFSKAMEIVAAVQKRIASTSIFTYGTSRADQEKWINEAVSAELARYPRLKK